MITTNKKRKSNKYVFTLKGVDTEKVDKSLSTVYNIHGNIPELRDQIKEMRNFNFS